MRFKASHMILIAILCSGIGVVMGALLARAQGAMASKIPTSLIVHCPDGFQIEFHGEFELANGDKMRTLFCETPEPEVEQPAESVEDDQTEQQTADEQQTTPSQGTGTQQSQPDASQQTN